MRLIEQRESGFMAILNQSGLIRVSGEDALAFIHGQLSQDVLNMKAGEARFAGYCTPEGRLWATMLLWKSGGDVWLLVSRDILPSLLKRLQMYVLRAKVTMTDVSDAFVITGFAGKKAADALASMMPELPDGIYAKTDTPSGTLIRVRDAFGAPRFLWIASPDEHAAMQPAFSSALTAGNEEDWELGDILAAIPRIDAATQNRFVPQMVNLEQVGGLSFTKGCYPGQEVVARTQYRGTLKRRMMPAHAEMPGELSALALGIVPGLDVFDAENAVEPCGMLVRAARRDESRVDCLVVVSRDVLKSESLRLGAPDGPMLFPDPLPYALPDEA